MKRLRSKNRSGVHALSTRRVVRALVAPGAYRFVLSSIAVLSLLMTGTAQRLQAASEKDEELLKLTLDQNLGKQVPPDLVFTDSEGEEHRLGDYFGERPMILVLGYYECPMLCSLVLNGTSDALTAIDFMPGEDYDLMFVSIDPEEDSQMAAANKRAYTKRYDKPGSEEGWHFMTGTQANITELARVVGFNYQKNEDSGEYAHPSGIMILTPEGKLSKYFYGIEYKPRALRLAMVEASGGQIGNPVDQLLLLCCRYNPVTGEYGWLIDRVIKIACGLTVLVLLLVIGGYLWRERRQHRKAHAKNEDKEEAVSR